MFNTKIMISLNRLWVIAAILALSMFSWKSQENIVNTSQFESVSRLKNTYATQLTWTKTNFKTSTYLWWYVGIYSSCDNVSLSGTSTSGIYDISVQGRNESFEAYCELNTDGGNWMVSRIIIVCVGNW